jgi:hypothetical protein
MLKWTWIMVVLAAGCSDPTFVIDVDPDEPVPTEETGETTGATDETEGTVPETTGSVSDTGTGSGSATGDTGSATADTGSGTGDSDTVPACWLSCMSEKSGCQLGSVVIGRCPNAEWCCEPKVVDTDTGTGTGVPCTGTCGSGCGTGWHKIDGVCEQSWKVCCEKDADTGSATVDSDTNPQPCPTDDPLYSCEYRIHCDGPGGYNVDTDYYCADPVNFGCCRHPY